MFRGGCSLGLLNLFTDLCFFLLLQEGQMADQFIPKLLLRSQCRFIPLHGGRRVGSCLVIGRRGVTGGLFGCRSIVLPCGDQCLGLGSRIQFAGLRLAQGIDRCSLVEHVVAVVILQQDPQGGRAGAGTVEVGGDIADFNAALLQIGCRQLDLLAGLVGFRNPDIAFLGGSQQGVLGLKGGGFNGRQLGLAGSQRAFDPQDHRIGGRLALLCRLDFGGTRQAGRGRFGRKGQSGGKWGLARGRGRNRTCKAGGRQGKGACGDAERVAFGHVDVPHEFE